MKKQDILKFYSKYRLFLFPTAVVLSTLFLIAFVILPQTIKLISNQRESGDLLNKTQFLEVKAKELEEIDQNDLSKKVEQALNVYPAERDFSNVLGLIQKLTTQTGFSIVSFSVGGSSAKNAQSYTVSLQLIGPKVLIPTVLNGLENGPRLIKVESIEISQPAGGGGIIVNLGLNVLFSPLPQNFGTVDSPLPQISQSEEELLVRLAAAQEESGIAVPSVDSGEVVPTSPRGKANPFE